MAEFEKIANRRLRRINCIRSIGGSSQGSATALPYTNRTCDISSNLTHDAVHESPKRAQLLGPRGACSDLVGSNRGHATPDSCDWSNRRFPCAPHSTLTMV